MSLRTENTRRSNHSIFLPLNFGSPFNDMSEHIVGLGLARLDFERGAVAGEMIYSNGELIVAGRGCHKSRITADRVHHLNILLHIAGAATPKYPFSHRGRGYG